MAKIDNLKIRTYIIGEEKVLRKIFFEAVHKLCSNHYSNSQLDVWAPEKYDIEEWDKRINKNKPVVAIFNNEIIGFADIQSNGYIDQFFISPDFAGKGVASFLLQHLEQTAKSKDIKIMTANVSITAKSFFGHCGFVVETEQQVSLSNVSFKNYKMNKPITN